eukprot:TRINITY_DN1172_c0_g1_i3.p1 TRINITY_DN1172_c0_g1~~TRINITY_DN1172_c0_g1_i3.p1  ORF type:complete len:104 (-),score=7.16 TRINITY_DN1172_c0_g1_i3:64-375(-)
MNKILLFIALISLIGLVAADPLCNCDCCKFGVSESTCSPSNVGHFTVSACGTTCSADACKTNFANQCATPANGGAIVVATCDGSTLSLSLALIAALSFVVYQH